MCSANKTTRNKEIMKMRVSIILESIFWIVLQIVSIEDVVLLDPSLAWHTIDGGGVVVMREKTLRS